MALSLHISVFLTSSDPIAWISINIIFCMLHLPSIFSKCSLKQAWLLRKIILLYHIIPKCYTNVFPVQNVETAGLILCKSLDFSAVLVE